MFAQNERSTGEKWAGRRALSMVLLVGFALMVSACDFDVSNPGPVNDENLNTPAAHDAVVNGVIREMNNAVNWIGIDVAVRTRQLHATQPNDWIGVDITAHQGTANSEFLNSHWEGAQRARWMGEDAIRRFQETMEDSEFSSNPAVARAHLWTGYANRLLGEYFCQAVFDNGSPQPNDAYFERAAEVFTTAIETADAAGLDEAATAARAGRASARVHLGDWSGAVSDAQAVATDFSYVLPYDDSGDWRYYNAYYYYANAREPYHGLTVWNTYYEDYYEETGDPRTAWEDHPDHPFGSGSLEPWGEVPWYTHEKYHASDDPVEMSSGEEMRLIEAEAMLRDGNMEGAMQLLNDLRARAGVEPWPEPSSLEEAWSFLKKERGIELWLEARRLGDRKRWDENGTPGEIDPHELGLTENGPGLQDAPLCLPIAQSERETNPNIGM